MCLMLLCEIANAQNTQIQLSITRPRDYSLRPVMESLKWNKNIQTLGPQNIIIIIVEEGTNYVFSSLLDICK